MTKPLLAILLLLLVACEARLDCSEGCDLLCNSDDLDDQTFVMWPGLVEGVNDYYSGDSAMDIDWQADDIVITYKDSPIDFVEWVISRKTLKYTYTLKHKTINVSAAGYCKFYGD